MERLSDQTFVSGGLKKNLENKNDEMKNYYAVLGLQKEKADEDDIKKAYRKLAMEHHPDRGGDEEKFKEISEAYAVLSDKDKKKSYDFTGHVSDFDFSMMDIFNSFFDNLRRPPLKSEDRYITLKVTLEEVMMGSVIKFRLRRKVLQERPIDCKRCGGKGYVYSQTKLGFSFSIASSSSCRSCQGTGMYYKSLKSRYENVILDVHLAPGTPENHKFFYPNLSDEEPGNVSGDLYLVVRYSPHPRFLVDGVNLVCVIDINWLEYFSGFERCIHHLNDEKIRITSKPMFVIPSEFCLKGEGLTKQGNLVIRINIVTTGLSLETIENIVREVSRCQSKETVIESTDRTYRL